MRKTYSIYAKENVLNSNLYYYEYVSDVSSDCGHNEGERFIISYTLLTW